MAASAPADVAINCVDCGGHCGPGDEVFLAGPGDEVFLAVIKYSVRVEHENGSHPEECDVFDDTGAALRFAPLFFDPKCWNEVSDGLLEIIADQLPLEYDDDLLCCGFCGSSILEMEYYCRIKVGNLETSPRHPGEALPKFNDGGVPGAILCLSCMTHIAEEVLEIWMDVTQQGECGECAHVRCWREASCSLDCSCHSDEEDEEDEEEDELYERGESVRYTTEFRRHVPPGISEDELEGTVMRDQADDEDDIDIRWNDGTISQVHRDHITRV